MARRSRAKEAHRIAEAIASNFLEEFGSNEKGFRGAKFVWPDTYIDMVGNFTRLHCNLAGLKPNEAADEELGRQVARRLIAENPHIK